MELSLAPIHGMTHAHFRNIYHDLFGGIDTFYAPFIGTSLMRRKNSSLFNDILPKINHPDIKLIPQMLSNNSEDFNYFANRIMDHGYKEINWNIGCPFHKITKKIKGSGLLPYPELIKAFLDDVCKNQSYGLTIKMRLGLTHLDEGARIIELLNDYPLKGLIIHARTGSQLYSGQVDLEAFELLRQASKHIITYNGDIYTYEDYLRIQKKFPTIDKFMIGRGALRNPFLASEIKEIDLSPSLKLKKIQDFHNSLYHYICSILPIEKRVLNNMKEFWDYLAHYFDPSGNLIKEIQSCITKDAYLKIINNVFK